MIQVHGGVQSGAEARVMVDGEPQGCGECRKCRSIFLPARGRFGFSDGGARISLGQLFQFNFDSCTISCQCFGKQIPLQRRQGFIFGAELNTSQPGQLKDQCQASR